MPTFAIAAGVLAVGVLPAGVMAAPSAGAQPGVHVAGAAGEPPSPPAANVSPLPTSGPPPIPGEGPDPEQPAGGRGPRPDIVSNGTSDDDVTLNWSGEVAAGSAFTTVSGYWTVPPVVPSTSPEYAADWIGIGGYGSTDEELIQTGTTSQTSGGGTSYYAWYEMLPRASVAIREPVTPGNQMFAAIEETSTNVWTIEIEDVTKGWRAEGTFSYDAGTASSAEWITERPEVDTALSALADYGMTRFHGMSSDPTAGATPIEMVDTTGYVISHPGPVYAATTGDFTDYYETPLPSVTSVSPSEGSTSGGTTVTVEGTYLVPGHVKSVQFGSTPATWTIDAGVITARSPAGTAGTVNVTVTTTGGTSPTTSADRFTYVSPPAPTPTPAPSPSPSPTPTPTPTPSPTPTPATTISGYDLVGSDGGVFVFPSGQSGGFYGSLPGLGVTPAAPVAGMVPTADDQGYFLVGQDGGVFAFGNAPFLGSLPGDGVHPAEPVVGIVPTADDQGYFLVGRDGGVFAFGDAGFYGSLPSIGVRTDDVVGIAATPSGNGYWVVTATGRVYAFGAAQSLGSVSGSPSPVSAIAGTPSGQGYWVTTQDGAVYSFGNAGSFGSLPADGVVPAKPVIGIVRTADTGGYWLLGADGGIFAFGDAPFVGSLPGLGISVDDIVGAVPTTG